MVDIAQRQRTTFPSSNILTDVLRRSTAQNAGAFGSGNMTPSEIRQDAINRGQQAGLPNRISFAGESGRDILNPNEMRVNAPSYEDWKEQAQRKIWMDRMYQQPDNPYYGQDAGITNRNLGGARVMNATSYLDPTADDYFLREFGHYLKRFLPGYDPEGDEFRQKKYREDNPIYDPNNPNHFMMEEEPEYIADLPISDVPFIPLNPERSNKEYSKFQVNANEALERENIQNAYNDFKMMGKNPMFFETSATSPNLIDAFKEYDMYEPGMDLMSLPYDADMSPSITMDEIMKFANTPRYNI